MSSSRRIFLKNSVIASALLPLSFASADDVLSECSTKELGLIVESNESPFFEHYHQLSIPVSALINVPADGVVVKTSVVDQGSYDEAAFDKFISSSGLDANSLSHHDHELTIAADQLLRIAKGEKNVEIRVISKSGNYVHNFLVTASPMVLAKIRRGHR